MKLLEIWVHTPLAGALGWTLLHSLWEGILVSAALAAGLLATRSARTRYAMACVALVTMLAAFGVTFAYMMPEVTDRARRLGPPVLPVWNLQSSVNGQSPWKPELGTIVPWFAPFWFFGVWLLYLKHLIGWISIYRLRHRGVCCPPEYWQKEVERLSSQLRLSRPIRLLESCLADTPMVLGHVRPLILVPIGLLTGLPAGQVEAILLHELAHIRRYDYLVNAMQRLVEGLLFYQPAVWWISRVVRTERENCCDDLVVAMSGNAYEYGMALAALEQNRGSGQNPAVAATGGNLMNRIRRLLYPPKPSFAGTPLFAAAVLIVIAAVALAAWPSTSQSSPSVNGPSDLQVPSQTDAQTADPFLGKWLNQDVVYIITDEEEAAFKALATDEERYHFIEQFWSRRDPTPDTVENEYRDEHYRRIANANERFRTAAGKSGWQTDRGRMYIVYGPPDQIESHPLGDDGGPPFEIWRYNHIQGVGDDLYISFIDRMRTGDYHTAPTNGRNPTTQ
jgi:GWxTD domain-containing protein